MAQRLDYSTVAADGMKALGGVYSYVAHSGLPKALVDLVYLRVSQINGCAYCIDMHSRDLLKGCRATDKTGRLATTGTGPRAAWRSRSSSWCWPGARPAVSSRNRSARRSVGRKR